MRYIVTILKNGKVYDRQSHNPDEMSIGTYVTEMLSHGYTLIMKAAEEIVIQQDPWNVPVERCNDPECIRLGLEIGRSL